MRVLRAIGAVVTFIGSVVDLARGLFEARRASNKPTDRAANRDRESAPPPKPRAK